jgi:hypothetical protein
LPRACSPIADPGWSIGWLFESDDDRSGSAVLSEFSLKSCNPIFDPSHPGSPWKAQVRNECASGCCGQV